MKEYHKIETLLNRDPVTFKVNDIWRLPEFEYLKDCRWEFTEKVDGTNTRVIWEGKQLRFGGKTDNAQIPTFLLSKLQDLCMGIDWVSNFPDGITLYGEGYGAKIQKGGGNYNPSGVDFILFDVRIGDWWLKREDVQDVATKCQLQTVPIVGIGTLPEAITKARSGFKSYWGNFDAEGLVVRPLVELTNRMGNRIIGKIKTKDF